MALCSPAALILALVAWHAEGLQTSILFDGAINGQLWKTAQHSIVSMKLWKSGAFIEEQLFDPNSSFVNKSMNILEQAPKTLDFVRINGDGDSKSLRKSLIVSTIVALAFLSSFSFLRYWMPTVYTREKSAGMEVEDVKGIWEWLYWVWNTTPDQEVEAAGLDGWSVLAVYRLGTRLFAYLGFFLMSVFIPLHWAHSNPALDPLSRLDMGSLPSGSPVFWVHAFAVWFVVLSVNSSVLQAHHEFLERRFAWLSDIPEPRASTLMVENIPMQYRSDEALKAYFVSVFKEEAVESAYIVRKTPTLRAQMTWLGKVKYQLMLEESRWEQEGSDPDRRALVKRCEDLREEALAAVAKELKYVEESVATQNEAVVSHSGFVTFTSEFWQRLASKEQYRADVRDFTVSMPPDPEDVLWQDLAQARVHAYVGEMLGWACLVLIFLFWSPVVAFISAFTTLDNLAKMMPSIKNISETHPSLQVLIEGFLATATLKLFLSFLPNMLMFVIRRFFYLKAGTLAQLRLQRWYYSFLLLFVLLVSIVGRSALLTATEIARNPGSVIDRLSASLPSASHFYLSYVVLGWFTVSFETIRFFNLVSYSYLRVGHRLEPSAAKGYSEPEDEDAYGVGARMGMGMLMCSITIVFCSCSPLILAFATVYFAIGRMTYGYLLVYAERKKPDLGGPVFVEAMRQVLFVLLVYVLEMTGVLLRHSQKASATSFSEAPWSAMNGPPIIAASSVVAVYWAWRRLDSYAWDSLPLEEVVRAARAREQRAESEPNLKRCGRYVQRECDLELLLEDAENVATARAREKGSILTSVHDYVRTTADLLDFATRQVTNRGTDVAAAALDTGLGAVDQTVWGFTHYGTTGAQTGLEVASTLYERTLAMAIFLAGPRSQRTSFVDRSGSFSPALTAGTPGEQAATPPTPSRGSLGRQDSQLEASRSEDTEDAPQPERISRRWSLWRNRQQ